MLLGCNTITFEAFFGICPPPPLPPVKKRPWILSWTFLLKNGKVVLSWSISIVFGCQVKWDKEWFLRPMVNLERLELFVYYLLLSCQAFVTVKVS